jgi:hypothetical protein
MAYYGGAEVKRPLRRAKSAARLRKRVLSAAARHPAHRAHATRARQRVRLAENRLVMARVSVCMRHLHDLLRCADSRHPAAAPRWPCGSLLTGPVFDLRHGNSLRQLAHGPAAGPHRPLRRGSGGASVWSAVLPRARGTPVGARAAAPVVRPCLPARLPSGARYRLAGIASDVVSALTTQSPASGFGGFGASGVGGFGASGFGGGGFGASSMGETAFGVSGMAGGEFGASGVGGWGGASSIGGGGYGGGSGALAGEDLEGLEEDGNCFSKVLSDFL